MNASKLPVSHQTSWPQTSNMQRLELMVLDGIFCPGSCCIILGKKMYLQGFGRERRIGTCRSAYSLPQRGKCSDYMEAGIAVCLGNCLSLWAIMEEKKETSLFWDGIYQRVSSRTLPKNAWSWVHFSPRPYRSWAEACEAANSS